ncbi:MAG: 50S ribosomal protein L25/general stress protein Ctc [Candidatus Competibacteraceae bacterium]|nr:50S ribosomal protein L25/general stress protein Ctc [Candidatus Competibacteraceae bacterium]
MSVEFELKLQPRDDKGKGASRRLRRQGMVPAVLYGGNQAPETLAVEQRLIKKALESEAFYSHVLTLHIGDRQERAVLRDLQRHPFKPEVMHMDLQRVSADAKVRVHVPIHFINQETSKGVKQQGGMISHQLIELEVVALPDRLPEFIEVDLADLGLNESIHLSELRLPEGVEITALGHGQGDTSVVSIVGRRGPVEGEEEAEGEEGAA